MKKLLTVSLFAIMAVSAANADIASTEYVGTQMNLAEKIANKVTIVDQNSVDEKYPSAKAVYNAIKTETGILSGDVSGQITTATEALTDQIDEASGKIKNLEDALKADGTTGQAIAAAQAQADKGVEDAATAQAAAEAAQGEVDALETVVANNKTAAETALSTAVSTLEGKITTAGADTTALAGRVTTAEGEIDALQSGKADKATTLAGYGITDAMTATEIAGAISTATTDMATTANVATAKSEAATDAQSKADAAEAAAIAASDPKGSAAQALVDAKAFTTQEINALSALAKFPAACAQGVSHCSLTIKDGDLTWEIVQ